MRYSEFLKKLWGARWEDEWEVYGSVVEGATAYPLLVFHSPRASAKRRELIITAGFHGEEQAGPMTILRRGEEIVDYARSRGVAVSIYPCINPTGFEDKRRYNRSGERPNNAFIEYELVPGEWTGELPPGEMFRRWRVVSEHSMAKETKAFYDRIKAEEPVALLDLHQDDEYKDNKAYAYVFGKQEPYLPLLEATKAHAEILVDARVEMCSYSESDIRANSSGIVEYHDGSVIDYFWRKGTDYVATLETTTSTPLKVAMEINFIWAKGFIDLVAKRDGDS